MSIILILNFIDRKVELTIGFRYYLKYGIPVYIKYFE